MLYNYAELAHLHMPTANFRCIIVHVFYVYNLLHLIFAVFERWLIQRLFIYLLSHRTHST